MEEEKSIFNIEIDQQGAAHIRRIHRLMRISFWISLAVNGLLLVNSLIEYLVYQRTARRAGYAIQLRLTCYMLYMLLSVVCSIVFIVYFLRFSTQARNSLVTGNSYSFNRSFSHISRCLISGIISLLLSAVYYILSFFVFQ